VRRRWWRQVAQVASIVREVYFGAPKIYKLGIVQGSRTIRQMFRAGAGDFHLDRDPAFEARDHAPASRHDGLRRARTPAAGEQWFELTKLQALAARTVAKRAPPRVRLVPGAGRRGRGRDDPDKHANACVYLWTRNPKLCDAPRMRRARVEHRSDRGPVDLPAGLALHREWKPGALGPRASISRLTQDPQPPSRLAYGRAVASSYAQVNSKAILDAEKAVIALHFGGSRAAYIAALRHDRASVAIARGIIETSFAGRRSRRAFASEALDVRDFSRTTTPTRRPGAARQCETGRSLARGTTRGSPSRDRRVTRERSSERRGRPQSHWRCAL